MYITNLIDTEMIRPELNEKNIARIKAAIPDRKGTEWINELIDTYFSEAYITRQNGMVKVFLKGREIICMEATPENVKKVREDWA